MSFYSVLCGLYSPKAFSTASPINTYGLPRRLGFSHKKKNPLGKSSRAHKKRGRAQLSAIMFFTKKRHWFLDAIIKQKPTKYKQKLFLTIHTPIGFCLNTLTVESERKKGSAGPYRRQINRVRWKDSMSIRSNNS